MQPSLRSVVGALRRPEYTGSNRCLVCTVVNCCIAVVLIAALGGVSPVLGGVGSVVLFGMIYLRGYLIPGTPTLTKQYFPRRILRWFGKASSSGAVHAGGQTPEEGDGSLFSVSKETRLVTECPDKEDICIDRDFYSAWQETIDTLRDDTHHQEECLIDMLDADINPSVVSLSTNQQRVTATTGDETIGSWQSQAAFLADVAAATVLGGEFPDWRRQSVELKSKKLAQLRLFLEDCPSCGGPTAIDAENGAACCWSREVATVRCVECEALILKVDELEFDDGRTTYL